MLTLTIGLVALATAQEPPHVEVHGLAQVRMALEEGERSWDATLRMPRGRLQVNGSAAENVGFQVLWETAAQLTVDEGATTFSPVTLLDAYLDWAVTESVVLRVGQFRTPASLQTLVPIARTALTERSRAEKTFGRDRDVGVMGMTHLLEGHLYALGGVFAGEGRLPTGPVGGPLLVARVGYDFGTPLPLDEVDLDRGGWGLGLGLAGHGEVAHQEAGDGADPTVTASVNLQGRGLSVGMEGHLRASIVAANTGAHLVVAYTLPRAGITPVAGLTHEEYVPLGWKGGLLVSLPRPATEDKTDSTGDAVRFSAIAEGDVDGGLARAEVGLQLRF